MREGRSLRSNHITLQLARSISLRLHVGSITAASWRSRLISSPGSNIPRNTAKLSRTWYDVYGRRRNGPSSIERSLSDQAGSDIGGSGELAGLSAVMQAIVSGDLRCRLSSHGCKHPAGGCLISGESRSVKVVWLPIPTSPVQD